MGRDSSVNRRWRVTTTAKEKQEVCACQCARRPCFARALAQASDRVEPHVTVPRPDRRARECGNAEEYWLSGFLQQWRHLGSDWPSFLQSPYILDNPRGNWVCTACLPPAPHVCLHPVMHADTCTRMHVHTRWTRWRENDALKRRNEGILISLLPFSIFFYLTLSRSSFLTPLSHLPLAPVGVVMWLYAAAI